MLSVQCQKCGGTNTFDETKQIPTFCSFCGAHLPDMTKFVQESIELNLEKQRHDMEIEKIKESRKSGIGSNILLGFVLLIMLTVIVFGIIVVTRLLNFKH